MKIANFQIDSYIQKIAQEKIVGCLVFGPESSVVKHRSNAIAKRIVKDLSDPFLVANLSKARFAEEKSILLDEFLSFSMLGGRKLIMVSEVDAGLHQSLTSVLEARVDKGLDGNFILIQAGDLDKNSNIRKLAESNPHLASIACYEDDEKTIKKLIEQELSRREINCEAGVVSLLCDRLGKNRQVISSEIEKISSFVGEKKSVSIDELEGLIGLNAEISMNELILNFCEQKTDKTLLCAERLLKQGLEVVTIIRFLLNYLQKLYYAKVEIELGNLDFEAAVKSQKLFFKIEIEFCKHLKKLSLNFLIKNLWLLENLEAKIKDTNIPQKLVFAAFIRDSRVN